MAEPTDGIPADDGDQPSGTDAGDSEGSENHESLGPVLTEPVKDPVFQTQVIILGNFLISIVVVVILRAAYVHPSPVPKIWLGLEILVVAAGVVTAYTEYFDMLAHSLRSTLTSLLTNAAPQPYKASRFMSNWEARRPRWQGVVVYVLSALVIVALADLVLVTGLGIESPFVPLAVAPAVYGPFVAGRARAVMGLVAIVAVILIAIAVAVPISDCGGWRACSTHDPPSKHHRPRTGAYVAVTVTFMVIAGFISAARLGAEQDLASELRRLRARLPPDQSA